MKRKTSQKQEQILVRRALITELYAKGKSERDIAKRLDIPRSTVGLDLRVSCRKAFTEMQTYDQKVPHDYELMHMGIRLLLKKAWEVLDNEDSSNKAVTNAMHTIRSCYQDIRDICIDKIHIREVLRGEEEKESRLESWRDRQMREAYEAQRHRDEAVF